MNNADTAVCVCRNSSAALFPDKLAWCQPRVAPQAWKPSATRKIAAAVKVSPRDQPDLGDATDSTSEQEAFIPCIIQRPMQPSGLGRCKFTFGIHYPAKIIRPGVSQPGRKDWPVPILHYDGKLAARIRKSQFRKSCDPMQLRPIGRLEIRAIRVLSAGSVLQVPGFILVRPSYSPMILTRTRFFRRPSNSP